MQQRPLTDQTVTARPMSDTKAAMHAARNVAYPRSMGTCIVVRSIGICDF